MSTLLRRIFHRPSFTPPLRRCLLRLESLEDRRLLSTGTYLQTNLVSDLAGLARNTDPHLSNPWGIAYSPTGPFWVSDNNTGLSSLYDGTGQPFSLGGYGGNTVTIPPPSGSPMGTVGHPTGIVFNPTSDFAVPGTATGASTFIFATFQGTLSGWNGGDGTNAILAVDNSASAVYTGLALGSNASGNFLFAANFKGGTVNVFDKNFNSATLSGSFTDSMVPAGYAPFNIQNLAGNLLVTYAQVNTTTYLDVPGPGHGYVDEFDTNGNMVKRLIVGGVATSPLNSPWGLAQAPSNFGQFSNDLLVGNFGDGHISAFDPNTGAFLGQLGGEHGQPIAIDGLWAITFGNGATAGDAATLFFSAGIQGDQHGLFGSVRNRIDDITGRVLQSGQWWVGASNGSTVFSSSLWTTWSPDVTWVDVQTGDFNGDGQMDIAGRVLQSGQWWVGLSNGSSFTTSLWTTWSPNVTWVDVKVGDFDGDGKADIAGRVSASGDWWVAQSTGTSFVNSYWAHWYPGVTWVDVNVGNFAGDINPTTGKPMSDIVGRVLESGDWWTGVSSGSSFTTNMWGHWYPGVTWVNVVVGDFTGNGKADIAGRVLQSGQWWVAQSTGTSFSNSLWATWYAGVTWVDVQVGDFNGDGKADIAGRVLQSGQWWVARSTGSSFNNSLWATWYAGVTWVDVQVGDFNGDGMDDITGRVLASGQWWTGLSTGTAFSTSLWAAWNAGVTWVDVHTGDFT